MSVTITPNPYLGLWDGPVDINGSSVINAVYKPINEPPLLMGDLVFITEPTTDELLPSVDYVDNSVPTQVTTSYGIVVGGSRKGIYLEFPNTNSDDPNFDSKIEIGLVQGDHLKICTQGRCIARGRPNPLPINIGDPLEINGNGSLGKATDPDDKVVARSLQKLELKNTTQLDTFLAVDFQREGRMP